MQKTTLPNLADLAHVLLDKQIVQFRPDDPFTWSSGCRMPMYCNNRKNLSHHENREIINLMLREQAKQYDFDCILAVPSAGLPWGALLAQHFQRPLLVPYKDEHKDGYLVFEINNDIAKHSLRYDAYLATYPRAVPFGVCFAHKNEIPFGYIRPEKKDHGTNQQVEGDFVSGSSVFVNMHGDDMSEDIMRDALNDSALDLVTHGLRGVRPDFITEIGNRKLLAIEDLVSTGGSTNKVITQARMSGATIDEALCIVNYGFDKARMIFEKNDVEMRSLITYSDILAYAKEIEYISIEQATMLADWSSDPFGWGEKNGFSKVEN